MNLDWNHFTPWTALLGGMLIGLAAAGFVLVNGRIAGISGILGGLLGSLVKSGAVATAAGAFAMAAGMAIFELIERSRAKPVPAA